MFISTVRSGITFAQLASILATSTLQPSPSFTHVVTATSALTDGIAASYYPLQCALQWSYFGRLYYYIFAPFALMIAFLALVPPSLAVSHWLCGTPTEDVGKEGEDVHEWFFKDDRGQIQGPCTHEHMLAWFRSGGLRGDVLVAPSLATIADEWVPLSSLEQQKGDPPVLLDLQLLPPEGNEGSGFEHGTEAGTGAESATAIVKFVNNAQHQSVVATLFSALVLVLYCMHGRVLRAIAAQFTPVVIRGETLLAQSPNERYASSDHIATMTLGALCIALFGVGLPLATTGTVVWLHTTKRNDLPAWRSAFAFLYDGYRPAFYWWEGVVFLRKMFFVAIVLIPPVYDGFQMTAFVEIGSLVLFLAIQAWVRPHRAHFSNGLDIVMLILLLLARVVAIVRRYVYVASGPIKSGYATTAVASPHYSTRVTITLSVMWGAFVVVLLLALAELPIAHAWLSMKHRRAISVDEAQPPAGEKDTESCDGAKGSNQEKGTGASSVIEMVVNPTQLIPIPKAANAENAATFESEAGGDDSKGGSTELHPGRHVTAAAQAQGDKMMIREARRKERRARRKKRDREKAAKAGGNPLFTAPDATDADNPRFIASALV